MRVSRVVKIQVRRVCWGCGKQFERGSLLRSEVDASKGQIENSYWCKVCDKTLESENKNSFDRNITYASVFLFESWKENLKKYSRTYTTIEDDESIKSSVKSGQKAVVKEESKLIKFSTRSEQEVIATIEDDESIKSSTRSEQEVITKIEDDESIKSSTRSEQEVITKIEDDESIKSSTRSEQEVITIIEDNELTTTSTNGDYIEGFLKYFKAFNVGTLLNDLKGVKLDYENDHKFLDITDDLEEFEVILGQLLSNIESYIYEPVLKEEEDNRTLYLIYLANKQKNPLEKRLVGVADNIERLSYTVNDLLGKYIIGKNSESYNRRRFNDLNYLNTIPNLFVDEIILNDFNMDGIYLSEAE